MQKDSNKKEKLSKRISVNIGNKIEEKSILFRVFDEPRPKYIAKITATDKFLDKTILWAFPSFVKPNYVTIFRFITIPFIVALLIINDYKTAFVLFVVSALSDAIDGALARTRNQITDWGIVFDPFADKLLIASVGGILIFKFLNPILAFSIILLEIILISSAYYRFKGEVVPAKTSGKIKMILQSIGVSLIFLAIVCGSVVVLSIAAFILYLSLIFAILSIFVYISI